MANQSLKARRNTRMINERLQKADRVIQGRLRESQVLSERRQLIHENNRAQLLIEAMNERDLQQASAIIDKLRKLKGKGLKSLDSAIEQAETQLNKYTSGGPLTKAWTKMKGVVGINNPLVKFMTFANALETGFKQFPTIIKNSVDADLNANLDSSLAQLVPDEDKQKALINNMMKALSPKGFFGAFKKVPYVNRQDLVQELINVPIKNFAAILQQMNSGPNTQQVAGDLKDTATASGGVDTKGSEPAEPGKGTAGTNGTSPAKPPVGAQQTTPTGEKTQTANSKAASGKIIDAIMKHYGTTIPAEYGISDKTFKGILNVLAADGLLNAPE